MKVHMSNAYKVARFLEKHSMVEKVLYPGKLVTRVFKKMNVINLIK